MQVGAPAPSANNYKARRLGNVLKWSLAVVMGAAGGIGLAAARKVAGMGLRVGLLDRRPSVVQASQSAADVADSLREEQHDRAK